MGIELHPKFLSLTESRRYQPLRGQLLPNVAKSPNRSKSDMRNPEPLPTRRTRSVKKTAGIEFLGSKPFALESLQF
jgi:hypothetical protein